MVNTRSRNGTKSTQSTGYSTVSSGTNDGEMSLPSRKGSKRKIGTAAVLSMPALTILPPVKKPRPSDTLRDKYILGDVLGTGAFGEVLKAQKIQSGDLVAIKIVSTERMSYSEKDECLREISIIKKLNHPNIIKLFDHLEDEDHLYLVLELINGGELFDRILTKKHYSEKEARDVMCTLLQAVKHCHDRNIVHR
jgi:serine/threonine protein kinase